MTQLVSFIKRLILALDLIRKMAGGCHLWGKFNTILGCCWQLNNTNNFTSTFYLASKQINRSISTAGHFCSMHLEREECVSALSPPSILCYLNTVINMCTWNGREPELYKAMYMYKYFYYFNR